MTSPSDTLNKYREKGYNILCPTTKIEEIPDWHKVVFDLVKLSPNPDDRDVYPKDGKKDGPFILTGHALQKLSICAGVQWDPNYTRVMSADRHYVSYSALGNLPKVFGQAPFFAEGDVDMLVEEDKIRDAWESKKNSTHKSFEWLRKMSKDRQKSVIADKVRQEINFKRQHRMKLAATTAKNRVIRALLGVKPSYTVEELKKEFVMPRIVFQPDMKDPQVKNALLGAMVQSINGVFGPAPAQIAHDDAFDIPEEDYRTVPDDEDLDPDPGNGDGGPEPTSNPRLDFENSDKDDQVETLKELATLKGFSTKIITEEQREKGVPGILYALDQFNPKNRLVLFDQLISMPDLPADDKPPY